MLAYNRIQHEKFAAPWPHSHHRGSMISKAFFQDIRI
ncbi:hypothetical protein CFU_0474 [Collimonas fungivorans Ter331]|uniref:Uncharacterized protein n=1 Tax=Collimonas fungivorans (strain Ter331) TaxID=1005048 RepID=G0AGI1_COLFT|nr:hypothetical protein CFU_0474 [Collimonas fungivorans Ter331]